MGQGYWDNLLPPQKKMYVSPFAKKSGIYKFKISNQPYQTVIKEINDNMGFRNKYCLKRIYQKISWHEEGLLLFSNNNLNSFSCC